MDEAKEVDANIEQNENTQAKQNEEQETYKEEILPDKNASDCMIKLKNVEVYQGENKILDSVSIEVKKGELVFLVGRTGSGKSSLLKVLYADLPFIGDYGYVAGYDLSTIKVKEIPYLRRKIGMVFQDFQLLTDRNVYENLAFVLNATGWHDKKLIDAKINEVLDDVNLLDKINVMPFQLSGGEQQKIVIARSLLNDPEIILADEPTGNLDPTSSEDVMKIISNLNNKGIAVLMASHDLPVIEKYSSRTLWFNEGKIQDNE